MRRITPALALGALLATPAVGAGLRCRMLCNEKETAFKAGCRPVSRGSSFYNLNELEGCFGRS